MGASEHASRVSERMCNCSECRKEREADEGKEVLPNPKALLRRVCTEPEPLKFKKF